MSIAPVSNWMFLRSLNVLFHFFFYFEVTQMFPLQLLGKNFKWLVDLQFLKMYWLFYSLQTFEIKYYPTLNQYILNSAP